MDSGPWKASEAANAGADVAAGHRVRLYRSAEDAFFFKPGDPRGGTTARRRTAICLARRRGDFIATCLHSCRKVRDGYQRHPAAGHDRHAVVSLGAGLGRVSGLAET